MPEGLGAQAATPLCHINESPLHSSTWRSHVERERERERERHSSKFVAVPSGKGQDWQESALGILSG